MRWPWAWGHQPDPDAGSSGAASATVLGATTPTQVERAVAELELVVARRLSGLLQGDHLGLLPGPGSEPGEGRAYVPGDDVRHIDWSLTARSGSTQVRDRIADRELETWLVVDCSASLDFGTAQWRKRDLVAAAVAAVGFLAVGGGNRLGAVLVGPDGVETLPARGGRAQVRAILSRLVSRPPAEQGLADLVEGLRRTAALAGRRGLVVVISDLLDEDDLTVPLRTISLRHELLVVEVRDPREDELPAVGLLTLVDPETGARSEVQTDDAALRQRFSLAAEVRREELAEMVRAAAAHHLVLSTDEDWLAAVAAHVGLRRRARR